MKNIHLLPTDKPSRLLLSKRGHLQFLKDNASTNPNNHFEGIYQNIYITSDEDPKHGDYVIEDIGGVVYGPIDRESVVENPKKIILTTDQDLINDGVQAIDDEFLEWFVKNPSCEEVDVIYDKDTFPYGVETAKGYGWYKIIIPREEPKQRMYSEEEVIAMLLIKHDGLSPEYVLQQFKKK
jgi:hypothetical protein